MTLSNRAASLLLVAYCLALYLPGIAAVPPFDQDEALFAQSAKQMLETGDFIQIKFQAEARSKKPVLSYWLEAAAAGVTGQRDAIWPYRIPAVAGVTVATLLTFWCGIRLFGRPAALLGAALFATSLMAVIQAHMARADALLIAIVVAAQGALAVLHGAAASRAPPPPRIWLVFWVAQSLGVLIKGPILAMTTILTIAALLAVERDWRWLRSLRPLPGLAIAIGIATPWFVAANLAAGGDFAVTAISEDLLPKLLGVQEGHGGPPGYYLLTGLLLFWPATLLLGIALPYAWRNRSVPAIRFCAAWIVPSWIAYELIPTKLPHYTMPTYPALALVAAAAVVAQMTAAAPAATAGTWRTRWAFLPFVGVTIGCAVFAVALPLAVDGRVGAWSFVVVGTGVIVVSAVWPAWRGDWRRALATTLVGAGLGMAVEMQFVLPSIDDMWLSRKLARTLAELGVKVPGNDPPVAVGGFGGRSLVFLLGTNTVVSTGIDAANHAVDHPGAIAAVAGGAAVDFQARVAERGATLRKVGRVEGFDYTRGVRRTLDLYIATPAVSMR